MLNSIPALGNLFFVTEGYFTVLYLAAYQENYFIHVDCHSIILQFRINVLQLLTSCWRAISVPVRQERQILSHFVVTDAIETKRQIIDFNGSCLKLATIV